MGGRLVTLLDGRLPAGTSKTTAPVEGLDELFGDPRHPGPFDYASIVADDDARRLSSTAEALLDEWAAAAEFVPASLGGRWVSTEDLVRRWRPIFRRDPALGLGYGLTTLMASLNVWVAGDDAQRREVAARLLRGERIAVGFHELDHGNDLLANECAARPDGDGGWVVTGAKQVINNVDRAESVLVMARTSPEPGARSHSLLLWHKDAATRPLVDTGRRVLTAGMRGCRIGVAEFHGLPLPGSAVVGATGTAAQTALTAFQVSRAVIPALAVATVDATLDLAVRYGAERSLYGGAVLDLPHARALLAGAMADLWLADALSAVVVRALHLAPAECLVLTAASKYLVPQLLQAAMQDLSVLFGSTFYARVAPYDVVEKFVRDLAVVPIGHAGSTACLLTILPNLPAWVRRSRRTTATDPDLFRLGEHLDELDLTKLSLGAGTSDPLGAALTDPDVAGALDERSVAAGARLAAELDRLRGEIAEASPAVLGADAPPEAFALGHRLALLLAGGAWAGISAHASPGSLPHDETVRATVFARLESRLAGRVAPLDADAVDHLLGLAGGLVDRGGRFTISEASEPAPAPQEEGDTR
ncbi:Acyl-CoA dehydrogenase [Agromyces sp. CF514]|uniref:acyl-CoA dehydrogenase n=1 Tax=Agromyces sp. CF514 TaxID=1881031 RepID=UPI0008E589C6|nr:acyl-CoA dehydrogenase [Agromyces sp. CF514]SFR72404.1 Acyl-CoA dehydrogenase [Agromyces sp. CF514]